MTLHLSRLTLSNNVVDPTNAIDIAAGACRSIADDGDIVVPSAITKTLSSWAVGSGQGALDTGSKANSTWYHAHGIRRPDTGVCDVLLSTSPTAPTMPGGGAYTQRRRLGPVYVDASGVIRPFLQKGGWFRWLQPIADANNLALVAGTSALLALSVPDGIKVLHEGAWFPRLPGNYFSLRDPDLGGAATIADAVLFSEVPLSGGQSGSGVVHCWTNTTRQVLIFGNVAGTLLCYTRGWYDPRDMD